MGDANLSEGEQSDVSLVAAGVRYLADIAHYEYILDKEVDSKNCPVDRYL